LIGIQRVLDELLSRGRQFLLDFLSFLAIHVLERLAHFLALRFVALVELFVLLELFFREFDFLLHLGNAEQRAGTTEAPEAAPARARRWHYDPRSRHGCQHHLPSTHDRPSSRK